MLQSVYIIYLIYVLRWLPFIFNHWFIQNSLKGTYVSEVVLKRLLTMDIYHEIKIKKETGSTTHRNAAARSQEDLIIVEKGKPIDYFILIIEGK